MIKEALTYNLTLSCTLKSNENILVFIENVIKIKMFDSKFRFSLGNR